ncbi:uncharacterized protein [Oscarella lobularis]
MGFSVDEPDQDGFTSLHLACQEGRAKTADFLLSAGANMEALDKWGYTPFLHAVLKGHSKIMEALIQRGCNIYAKTNDSNGALAIASQEGHFDIAKKLVVMGCSVNESHQIGYTALHWACQNGHSRTADFLISSGANIEALDKQEGLTPFLCAVVGGHCEIMEALIKHGCNVTAKSNDGNGALAIASQKGLSDVARKLVQMGVSINDRDQVGATALHWACQLGHAQTAEFLISAGADIEGKNMFGRTPLLEADFYEHRDVVEALVRILSSQIAIEEGLNKENQTKVDEEVHTNDAISEDVLDETRQENAEFSQKIYDEALKRGSVTVNRSRVIVAGQDGAGKSCLVDSLLNRPFEKDKASTEGAAVAMIHTATSGWVATESKDHLDPLIAEGVYRMNQKQLTLETTQKVSSESSSHFVIESKDLEPKSEMTTADESERCYDPSTAVDSAEPTPLVETLKENLITVGMEAKTLTANQQQLVDTFVKSKISEEELKKHVLGVRDIWDLGGQEVYLATHWALMPDCKTFGLSIYMVVMDISKLLSDKAESFHRSSGGKVVHQTNELGWIRTNGDFPLYWFGSITAAHEETPMGNHWLGKDEEVAPPPVFAIGSHRDVLDSLKEKFPDSTSVEKWLIDQGNYFEQLLSDSEFMKHIVQPKRPGVRKDDEDFREIIHFFKRLFLIDNSVSGSGSPCKGVKEIRQRVDRMTTTYWKGRKKQPLFWVYLEILLFRWSTVMKTVVAEVEEIVKLAQHPKICNISSRDEVLVALKYLANVGAILYYPEVDGLNDVVFTKPMWIINALSAFVTSAEPGPLMEPKWNILKKEGVMSNDLMNYRLQQMRDACFGDLATSASLTDSDRERIEDDNKLIVRLLELLDVITPAEGSNYYVPSMLKTSFLYPVTHWERVTLSDSESPRCYLPAPLIVIPRKLKFIPECLFFRLIIRFLKLHPNKPRLARHQCIFLVQDKRSPVEVEVELLYHNRGKWVALTLCFVNEDDSEKISSQFLASVKNELCQQMKHVCQQGMRGFKFSVCCQTKKAVRKAEEFSIDFESLPVIIGEDCDYSPKNPKLYTPFNVPLAVKREELLRINCWFRHQRLDSRPSSQDALPKEISKSLICVVATIVEAKWQKFAIFLGRKASTLPQYKEKSDENFLRAIMVIEDWISECGQKATVNALIGACEFCGFHRDIIEAAYKEMS